MQYYIQIIPASGSPEAQEELNYFLRSHRVVQVQRSLENNNGMLCWCFCVEWLEGALPQVVGDKSKKLRIDYKNILNESDFELFSILREARNLRAKEIATPSYNICTNEVLAEIARARPTEKSKLLEIEGFGEKKIEKHGEAFIKILTTHAQKERTTKSDS